MQERRASKQNQNLEDEKAEPGKTPSGDWGEFPIAARFYGRESELESLKQWIITEQDQIVAIVGLGGVGKTALAEYIANKVRQHFHCLFWYSLQNAQSIEHFLKDCIQFVSGGEGVEPGVDLVAVAAGDEQVSVRPRCRGSRRCPRRRGSPARERNGEHDEAQDESRGSEVPDDSCARCAERWMHRDPCIAPAMRPGDPSREGSPVLPARFLRG